MLAVEVGDCGLDFGLGGPGEDYARCTAVGEGVGCYCSEFVAD